MQTLYKKRYFYAFVLALCLFFAVIAIFHSYYNLKNIVQAPSDSFGRSTSLVSEDLFKKQPSVKLNDEYADILAANKTNFTHMRINRASREVDTKIININGVETFRVQKFEWDEQNIYFTERNILYYAQKNSSGEYVDKIKVADEVSDFDLLHTKEGLTIIAAQADGIAVYRQNGNAFVMQNNKLPMQKVAGLSAISDEQGTVHIAAYGQTGIIEHPIYYIVLKDNNLSLEKTVIEKSISESWNLSNIDIGIDDTDIYIFYNMIKRDKFGIGAKVHYAAFPINSNETAMNFKRLFIEPGDAENPDSYLNEAKVIKNQDGKVVLSIVKDSIDKRNISGFTGFLVEMDNGAVVNAKAMTRNQALIVDSIGTSYNDDYVFVYLNAAGGFNYEAFYTESGKNYFENSLKATSEDYQLAFMEAIPGYVSTILISFIKLTVYFPVIIWFLAIEFFEIKKLREKPKLTFAIGIAGYLIIKLISFNTYYTEFSITQMPPTLTFFGAKYIIAVGILAVSLMIQRLMKKHNPEIHQITQFIIFSLIDIEFTNLLFATYMV